VLLEVTQNHDVICQRSRLAMKLADTFSERTDIALALHSQSCASLGDLMTMMKVLDRLLEADCDAQSDDDCGNVNEESLPGVRGFMRRVDIEHRFGVLLNCI
jgi:hypothetical protein